MRFVIIFTVFSAGTLFSAELMNISVCNLGRLPDSLVAKAETEASHALRAFGIEVVWAKCGDELGPSARDGGSRFVIRRRNDRPPETSGLASLDAMGRAFLSDQGDGFIADVYYKAVQAFASQHTADLDGLIGYVIVHEVGHLLLGPGHSPRGIMHATWKGPEAMALNRRWMKFTAAQQAEILRKLRAINAEGAAQ
jgi:hypothetical protein